MVLLVVSACTTLENVCECKLLPGLPGGVLSCCGITPEMTCHHTHCSRAHVQSLDAESLTDRLLVASLAPPMQQVEVVTTEVVTTEVVTTAAEEV